MDSLSVLTGGSMAGCSALEQVVLHDIAHGACLVVEGAPALDPNSSAIVIWTLSTVIPVPERRHERVRNRKTTCDAPAVCRR